MSQAANVPIDPAGRPPAYRIVIADDHDLLRWGLKMLFGKMPGFEVVAEARSGRELIEAVDRLHPALVVTDLSMPDIDGAAAIATLRRAHPELRIVALSMHDTEDFIRRALRAGANGYLLKGAAAEEIEHAVRSVLDGAEYFSPRVAQRLAEAREARPEEVLTERQREVLALLVQGQSSKEIAFALGLSSKTVDVHRAAVMSRLGLKDMASLALYAVRNGLVDSHGLPSSDPPPST